jgi:hypothetical protein
MTRNSPKTLLNITIIPNPLLGGCIIALILANNLFKNHYSGFSHPISSMVTL